MAQKCNYVRQVHDASSKLQEEAGCVCRHYGMVGANLQSDRLYKFEPH